MRRKPNLPLIAGLTAIIVIILVPAERMIVWHALIPLTVTTIVFWWRR